MRSTHQPLLAFRCVAVLACAFIVALLSGCGTGFSTAISPAGPIVKYSYTGRIMGGQQPVAGASVTVYKVALFDPTSPSYDQPTLGYGVASIPLLYSPVVTDAQGRFTITGLYQCNPDNLGYMPGDLVYITASGGNPGVGSVNNNLMLMSAGLGPCTPTFDASLGYKIDELSQSAPIEVNELTTIASVYALSAFMAGPGNIGAPVTNQAGLLQAFADISQLVDTTTGMSPGPALPTGATLPAAEMNTLANMMASCVNSGGVPMTGPSTCGTLFAAATPPGGTAPTDTVTAMLNIAQHPGLNVSTLFALSTAMSPFQPALMLPPNDWTLAVNYKGGGIASPSSVAIDGSGNVWIANFTGSSVTELSHAGTVVSGSPFSGSISAPTAITIDQSGIPWVASHNNTIEVLNASGAPSVVSGGGLNAPTAMAFDPQGNLWVADGGSSTVSEFTSAGVPVNGSGFSTAGIVKPLGVAISPQ